MVASAPIPAVPILATKLYILPPPPKVVVRSRLIERLNEAPGVTLISAPAGFGKTTLISEWVATLTPTTSFRSASQSPSERAAGVAWLSLNGGDSDPARFLIYLVSALQTIAPKRGEGVLEVLHGQAACHFAA
jgi:LuxR family maltose regulon positive regulatory protein